LDPPQGNDFVTSKWAALGFVLLGWITLLRAEDAPDNQPLTPYQTALLDYKIGHDDDARTAIAAAEKEKPGDPATEILKARILTELGDFTGAKAALEGLNGNPGLTPDLGEARTMALGDMGLRKRSFDEAAKFYESLLSQKPGDPDIILKLVYARIGVADLVMAGKYASQLKPLDPDHPCYYFAKAALAQATGNAQEADDDIQTVRTIYGISVTNRYLKTYLEVFASSKKSPAPDITPPPLLKNSPR
jgi:tetratricopeptide (TPR) repeat protein